MIVKLVYTAANLTPANIRADIKQMILGTMTTTTDGNSVVHPDNLNATEADSIVYGTTYTNSNSLYTNTDSSVRYYTKTHSVYNTDECWFGFGASSTYLTAEQGLDDSDKTIKNYSTDITTLPVNSKPNTFYFVVTDTTLALFGQGDYGSDGFLYTDIGKNALSLMYTDTSTFVMATFASSTIGTIPYSFTPKAGFYQAGTLLTFSSTDGTPPIWDNVANKHKLAMNHLSIGSIDYGTWHVYGMYAINKLPTAQGLALMQDASGVYYLHIGRPKITSQYAGVLIKGE